MAVTDRYLDLRDGELNCMKSLEVKTQCCASTPMTTSYYIPQ